MRHADVRSLPTPPRALRLGRSAPGPPDRRLSISRPPRPCARVRSYDDGPPFLVAPSVLADGVLRYITPVPEFLVDRAEVRGVSSN